MTEYDETKLLADVEELKNSAKVQKLYVLLLLALARENTSPHWSDVGKSLEWFVAAGLASQEEKAEAMILHKLLFPNLYIPA